MFDFELGAGKKIYEDYPEIKITFRHSRTIVLEFTISKFYKVAIIVTLKSKIVNFGAILRQCGDFVNQYYPF